jgi:hypothetical protein
VKAARSRETNGGESPNRESLRSGNAGAPSMHHTDYRYDLTDF